MSDPYIPPGASEREIAIRKRVHAQAEFFQHLMSYLGVNAILWIINITQLGMVGGLTKIWAYWAIWPTLGWGIGIVVHGLSVFTPWSKYSADWEERKVRELMERKP